MTEREALKLALEALGDRSSLMKWQIARDAVNEALAQPEQEPVVCVEYIPCCTDQTCPKCKAVIKPELVCVCGAVWEGQELIYTTPQRTWVGLMRGVRVDGDTVVISVKGGNDAARELCGALIEEMDK